MPKKLEYKYVGDYFAEKIKLRLDRKNGLTFCEDCHQQFYLKYGYKNNNREQVSEFINACLIGV